MREKEEEAKRHELEKKHQELRLAEQSNLQAIRNQVMALAERSNKMTDTLEGTTAEIGSFKDMALSSPDKLRESPKLPQAISNSPEKPLSFQPTFEFGRNMEL